jgi:Spy/CpxP family protein refolding chaperone
MAGTTKVTRRVGTIAAAALLAAGVGGIAVARAQQPREGTASTGPCAPRAGFLTPDDREAIERVYVNRAKTGLGLTDQQTEEVRAALKARRDEVQADRQALCLAQVDLRRLLGDRNSDPAAVKAAGARVSALQAKLMDRRLDAFLTLRSKVNLSPDQWAKFQELQRGFGGRGPGGFGGGFGM